MAGRPSKQKDWLQEAEKVLNNDINAVILTDEELVYEVNERVPEEKQITTRTFENWKSKVKNDKQLDEQGKQFFRLIKKALIKQKKELFQKFREDEKAWQKWAWIIERKFEDWNIRYKTDLTTGGDKLTLSFDNAFTSPTEKDSSE